MTLVLRCQDGVRGVIESAFAALDEVYVLRHDSNQSLKMSTNQIAFLGEWSDSAACLQLRTEQFFIQEYRDRERETNTGARRGSLPKPAKEERNKRETKKEYKKEIMKESKQKE